jgi:hypothetical protein
MKSRQMTLNDLRLYLKNKNMKIGNNVYSHSELGYIFKDLEHKMHGEKSMLGY